MGIIVIGYAAFIRTARRVHLFPGVPEPIRTGFRIFEPLSGDVSALSSHGAVAATRFWKKSGRGYRREHDQERLKGQPITQ